jgi:L-fuconolactonase
MSLGFEIIDTHQHLWDLNQLNLPWMLLERNPNSPDLNRSFLMPDYMAATRDVSVSNSVYMEVNVSPEDQVKEANIVLEQCQKTDNPMARAVIGGYPHDPRFAKYVSEFAENPLVVGVRTVLHDPDRPQGLCLSEQFTQGCCLLGTLDLSFDLCMRPDELMDGVRLAERCPETHFILDHCGNMPLGNPSPHLWNAWMTGMKSLAQCDNVDCKISGIIVTASSNWTSQDLAEVINICLDLFGENRVCFGGDWPICTLRTSYYEWVVALRHIISDRTTQFQDKIFSKNARRIYKLSTPTTVIDS